MKKFWIFAILLSSVNAYALTLEECIQQALEIARVQYEAGVITHLEELDAELSAQTAYFAAVSGYLIARARLEKVVGQKIE